MPLRPLPGGKVNPHPCRSCGASITKSRSNYCRLERCQAQWLLWQNRKLNEIAINLHACITCGTALPDDYTPLGCRACVLQSVERETKRNEQQRQRRKQQAEVVDLTMRRLAREAEQKYRASVGLDPWTAGPHIHNTHIPEEDA
jgi:hypothetical protein